MRLYLDTNILYFLLLKNDTDISPEVSELLGDYSTVLYTSTICVQELIHLCHIGKIPVGKRKSLLKTPREILHWLDEICVERVPVSDSHLTVYADLPIFEDHRDPNDRLLIAQAISDRATLVSSDHKFSRYVDFGLSFQFNKR